MIINTLLQEEHMFSIYFFHISHHCRIAIKNLRLSPCVYTMLLLQLMLFCRRTLRENGNFPCCVVDVLEFFLLPSICFCLCVRPLEICFKRKIVSSFYPEQVNPKHTHTSRIQKLVCFDTKFYFFSSSAACNCVRVENSIAKIKQENLPVQI